MQANFSEAVVHGLSANPKRLPAEFLIDETGIQLLDEIRKMPEFYAAACEQHIFNKHAAEMAGLIYKPGLVIIEKGAGDTRPVYSLLKALQELDSTLRFRPIDNSETRLTQGRKLLARNLPGLMVHATQGEFFSSLESLLEADPAPKLILIPGSGIRNLSNLDVINVLKQLYSILKEGDSVVIGVDLKKSPSIILPAHSDAAGHCSRYHLNLLERINRELGGHFNTKHFKHYASYEPDTGELKNYLIAQKDQEVLIEKLNRSFHFEAWENMLAEISKKYSPEEFRHLSAQAGFTWVEAFYDPELFFMDVILKK